MPTIRQLPTSLINKIAAGEVIERPASVVKETLENSIDSGATLIELSVEKGGTEMIRVADNGCGIHSDQLLLAIAPHATSKLVVAEDLFNVQTLGFRGEALASIAEISHLVLRSRPAEQESGYELEVRGGSYGEPVPCATPIGTTLEIRNLFFNTPVRRKFLKSAQTEMGHIIEAFTRIAIAYPHVHMILKNNDRVIHDLPPTEDWSHRIRKLFDDEVADALIPVESEIDGIRLHGFAANPNVSRSNNRMQYLFLNGRYIRDRALQHALGEAYRSLLMVGRFPICFLHLEIPPTEVDVNVHPTKTEVRFTDSGRIYSQLLSTLRHKFLSSDLSNAPLSRAASNTGSDSVANLTSDFGSGPYGSIQNPNSPANTTYSSSGAFNSGPARTHTDGLLQWARGEGGGTQEFKPFPDSFGPRARDWLGQRGHEIERDVATDGSREASRPTLATVPNGAVAWSPDRPVGMNDEEFAVLLNQSATQVSTSTQPELEDRSQLGTDQSNETTLRQDAPHSAPTMNHMGFQVHNRYLVTEDQSGMVVIDQHALHERILYEQLRQRVLNAELETQRLLVPEPVSLTAEEAALALDSREVFSKVGIDIEPFGGATVVVTAYPAMLANVLPGDLVRQILESIQNNKSPESRELLDSLLHMIACKAAIKAGDRLTSEEVTALLEQRDHYQDTHHCPHGRPTALFFSREQLDKLFKRT